MKSILDYDVIPSREAPEIYSIAQPIVSARYAFKSNAVLSYTFAI